MQSVQLQVSWHGRVHIPLIATTEKSKKKCPNYKQSCGKVQKLTIEDNLVHMSLYTHRSKKTRKSRLIMKIVTDLFSLVQTLHLQVSRHGGIHPSILIDQKNQENKPRWSTKLWKSSECYCRGQVSAYVPLYS